MPLRMLALFLCLVAPVPAAAQQTLTLEDAVRIALDRNPALRAAAEEGNIARARAGQEQASWYPRLDVSQSFTRGNNPVYVFGTLLTQRQFTAANFALAGLNSPPPLDNFQTRLDSSWLLFDSGRTRHRVKSARRLVTAADFQTEQERQDLILRVVTSYYSVAVARGNADAAREALRSAEANAKRVQTMVDAGLVVESDLLSAQVHLAQMQERLLRAENAVELARMALAHELGLGFDSLPDPAAPPAEPTAIALSPDEWERLALAERPALRAAELEQQAAESGRRGAQSAYGPRVGVFANFERDAETLSGPSGTNWTAGARLEFNLFAGGADRQRIAEAQARERQAVHRVESFRSGVRLEVRQAFLETQTAEKRIAAARHSVEQARESLRIVQNRYEAGLTTITELLRAQAAQLDARTLYLSALHDWQTARAQLERAAGRLTADSSLIRSGETQ